MKWVFVPDGKSSVTVDYKVEVKDVPATSGHFWDSITNHPINAQRHSKIDETDYNASGHTLMGIHANGGITFDLGSIREQSGLTSMRLTGVVGFGASVEASKSFADFTVFVDGEMKFQRSECAKTNLRCWISKSLQSQKRSPSLRRTRRRYRQRPTLHRRSEAYTGSFRCFANRYRSSRTKETARRDAATRSRTQGLA